MQVSCSVETMAAEQDYPPGQPGHQIIGQGGFFLDTGRRPFLRGSSRAKARHSWSRLHFQKLRLGGFRFRLDRRPVRRIVCLVRGSGCFTHDARCQGDTPPRDPLSQGSWVNTTLTHGPPGTPFPRGLESTPHSLMALSDHQVVEIPRMDLRVKYLHSIDFLFICGKSICFSWFPVFAF